MARGPLLVVVLLGLSGAALAALARPPKPAPLLGPSDLALVPAREAGLFAQLAAADARWTPRAEPIPGAGTRYVYQRRAGDPPLSVGQVKALIRNPPRFDREQAAIRSLLLSLRRAGVTVALGPPRLQGAAGEFDARRRVLRIRPDIPEQGSREFAKVLNHEAIHVAQSCRRGEPLGLSRQLDAAARRHLAEPLYAKASARVLALEAEAYANQERLSLGPQLLALHCHRVRR